MQLYTPTDVHQLQQDLPYLIEIMEWLKNFVAKPHPDLGRSGVVCPFVPPSLKLNSIRLTVLRSKNLALQEIADIILPYLDIFLELEPREKPAALNKAILFIFPDIDIEDAPKIIDVVHKQLKPFFVKAGLMIGEFHNRTESPGLHNPNFRPLRSPIPMLVIRPMTEADLTFMHHADDPHLSITSHEAYLKHFAHKIKDEKKLKNAHQLLELAHKQLQEENRVH
ncbi:MAG: hypothetical protein KME57_09070 [Scytonema hyalinum WJT4-NPBG1]|jgi:hypothetical protein|nr:hypothetical protein [Scytonema hyalinum WJT4-NPBG1]